MSHDDAPDSTPRNALVALSRRLRTVPPKALPLVDRAVLLTIAGRADADWIAFPPVEWIAREAGTTENTVRPALDRLLASGWLGLEQQATARASARYRIRLDPVPPSGVQVRYPWQPRARGEATAPQGSSSSTPGVTELDPTGEAAAPADHRKIPSRSQADPIAPVHAHVRGHEDTKSEPKGEAVAMPLFPTSATSTPLPASGKRPKRDPSAPKAADLYAAAYVAGHVDAGGRMSPPTKAERALLGAIAGAHARGPDGAPLTGEAVIAWFRGEAKAFRKAVPDPQHHRGGYSPIGFRSWLDNGAPKPRDPWAVKPGDMVQPRPGPPPPRRGPPDDAPTPEERQRRIDKVKQVLRERAEEAGTVSAYG